MIRSSKRLVESWPHKKRRRGSILLETTVAIVLLATAIAAVAQTMAVLAIQRQSAERQMLATQEAANLMERMFVLPVDEITTEKAAELKLSPSCSEQLPEAKLNIAVELVGEDPPAKRINIEIEWTGYGGVRSQPVRVTAWRYTKKETAE